MSFSVDVIRAEMAKMDYIRDSIQSIRSSADKVADQAVREELVHKIEQLQLLLATTKFSDNIFVPDIKVLLIGPENSGKTTFINHFLENSNVRISSSPYEDILYIVWDKVVLDKKKYRDKEATDNEGDSKERTNRTIKLAIRIMNTPPPAQYVSWADYVLLLMSNSSTQMMDSVFYLYQKIANYMKNNTYVFLVINNYNTHYNEANPCTDEGVTKDLGVNGMTGPNFKLDKEPPLILNRATKPGSFLSTATSIQSFQNNNIEISAVEAQRFAFDLLGVNDIYNPITVYFELSAKLGTSVTELFYYLLELHDDAKTSTAYLESKKGKNIKHYLNLKKLRAKTSHDHNSNQNTNNLYTSAANTSKIHTTLTFRPIPIFSGWLWKIKKPKRAALTKEWKSRNEDPKVLYLFNCAVRTPILMKAKSKDGQHQLPAPQNNSHMNPANDTKTIIKNSIGTSVTDAGLVKQASNPTIPSGTILSTSLSDNGSLLEIKKKQSYDNIKRISDGSLNHVNSTGILTPDNDNIIPIEPISHIEASIKFNSASLLKPIGDTDNHVEKDYMVIQSNDVPQFTPSVDGISLSNIECNYTMLDHITSRIGIPTQVTSGLSNASPLFSTNQSDSSTTVSSSHVDAENTRNIEINSNVMGNIIELKEALELYSPVESITASSSCLVPKQNYDDNDGGITSGDKSNSLVSNNNEILPLTPRGKDKEKDNRRISSLFKKQQPVSTLTEQAAAKLSIKKKDKDLEREREKDKDKKKLLKKLVKEEQSRKRDISGHKPISKIIDTPKVTAKLKTKILLEEIGQEKKKTDQSKQVAKQTLQIQSLSNPIDDQKNVVHNHDELLFLKSSDEMDYLYSQLSPRYLASAQCVYDSGAIFELISYTGKIKTFHAMNIEEKRQWTHFIQVEIEQNIRNMTLQRNSNVYGSDLINILEVIKSLPGNDGCAECQAKDPEWASINLGVLLCIQCSGIHRSLGSEISKVRSLYLDSWKYSTLEIMSLFGNSIANSIWEESILLQDGVKPSHSTTYSEKQDFITRKYKGKAFLRPWTDVDCSPIERLFDSLPREDIDATAKLYALTHVDTDSINRHFNSSFYPGFTLLHLAASLGLLHWCQLIIWKGANLLERDTKERTPLDIATEKNDMALLPLLAEPTSPKSTKQDSPNFDYKNK